VLAEQVSGNKREAFMATISAALRHIIFWSSVIGVLVIVLRAYVVRVIYGSGAFDWDDTRLTAALLAVFMTALIAQGVTLLCARAFYAAGKSWQPLAIQAIGLVFSVTGAYGMLWLVGTTPMVGYFFEALLRVEGVAGSSIVAVGIGAAVGQLAMGVLSVWSLRRIAPGIAHTLLRPLLEGLGAAILGGTVAYWSLVAMGTLLPLTSVVVVLAEGAIAGIVGLAIAGSVLALLENQEFRDLAAALRRLKLGTALTPYSLAHDRSDS
jgi:peptidoglycan biosynthesis protein MviN/MurJ (putative lipid II flippase)